MNDAELLRALGPHKPPAAAYACALAARVLGHDAPIEETVKLTSLSPASVFRGRAWLDTHAPGWRVDRPDELPVATEDVETLDIDVPATDQALVLAPVRPPAPPVWRTALADAAAAARAGAPRSWDLYRDLYAPAADVCIADGEPGDLVALAADYLATVSEEPVATARRRQLAKLVRSYGKAGLYAIREAVMSDVDLGDQSALLRYARRVAENVLNEARSNGNGQ